MTRKYQDDPAVAVKLLKADIEKLRDWIRSEGARTDTCTYYVLGEVCEGCRCERKPNHVD